MATEDVDDVVAALARGAGTKGAGAPAVGGHSEAVRRRLEARETPTLAIEGLGEKGAQIAIAMGQGGAEAASAADARHRFWATQPVRKFSERMDVEANGPIEADTPPGEVRAEPYGLPAGFEWSDLDVGDPTVLSELYDLLSGNYVEDDDAMFRFAYSRDFLGWALTPPGFFPEWHVGVRVSKSRKLIASIAGVPAALSVYAAPPTTMCEINFLCVDKKLRAKRLAPVLIREVTRRVHKRGIFQAAYTAGVVLPRPITSARYWHRSVDIKKLVELKFSALPAKLTMSRAMRLYAVKKELSAPGLRAMTAEDVPSACALLNAYLSKFNLHPVFTEHDFAHWMLPREGVVNTWVLEARDGSGVTDLVSMYHLPSSVIGNPKHSKMRAAYLYYYAPGTLPLEALLDDALTLAATLGVDVVNCLDLMDNGPLLKKLKFQAGDGSLQYYLYNWNCPQMDPKSLGLVLL